MHKTSASLIPVVLSAAAASFAAQKTLVVSAAGSGATHSGIQAAVNACKAADTCLIRLVDPSYTLDRPVWIEGKANLEIVGATNSGEKPKLLYPASLTTLVANPLTGTSVPSKVRKVFTLPHLIEADGRPCEGAAANCIVDPSRPAGWNMWPCKAASAMGEPTNSPGDQSDTSNPYSAKGFQLNGMVVVKDSRDIVIRGLELDGMRPMYFENRAVWSQRYSVLSGTTGLNIFKSLRVTLQDCELKSFFAAIRILGDSTRRIPPTGGIPPATGGHLFERNRIHDNWWVFHDEMERDHPSVIRYNVAWNNINKSLQYGDSLAEPGSMSDEMNNHTGGFMYSADSVFASHRIHNNTLHKHGIVFGFSGWGAMRFDHDFHSNVLTGPVDSMKVGNSAIKFGSDWHQLLQYGGTTIRNNTFELEGGVRFGYQNVTQVQIVSDTLPAPNSPGKYCFPTACWINIEPVRYVSLIQPEFLWNNWGIAKGGYLEAFYTDKAGKRWGPFLVQNSSLIDSTGLITKMAGNSKDSVLWKSHQNLYAIQLPLQSRNPDNETFLFPDWTTKTVRKTVRLNGWRTDTTKFAEDRGAFCWDEANNRTLFGACSTGTASIPVPKFVTKGRSTRIGLHSALGKWDPKGRRSVRFLPLPK